MSEYAAGKCPNKNCSSNSKKPYIPVKVELDEKDPANDRHYFEARPHRCPTCRTRMTGWKRIII